MRKVNLRWLSGLILGSIGLGIVGFLLHDYQMVKNASSFIREAKRAQAENDPVKAAQHLRRYIKLAPGDSEGLILYGLQLADLGDISTAYLTLDRAIQKQPDRADVRRRLVGLAIKLRRFSEAMDYLQNHLLKESPKDGELLEQLSVCQFGRGEYKAAAISLESAIANAPQHLENFLTLASLRREKLDRSDESFDPINQMVDRNSDNYRAYLYRGMWLAQRLAEKRASRKLDTNFSEMDITKLQEAIDADAKKALELAPDLFETIGFSARLAQEAGRTDEARTLAQHGIVVNPADSRFYMMLSELESASGHPADAVDLLRKGVATSTPQEQQDLKWNLANLLIDQENFTEAAEIIGQLRAAKHPEALVNYLEARIKLRRNEWLAAIQQFEAVRPGLYQRPGLLKQVDLWLGLAYRETNRPDRQLTCFRESVALDPDWVPARMALAESLVSANQFQEAVTEFKKVLSRPEAPTEAALGLAKTLLAMNLRKRPDQRNWDEFDATLKRIEQVESLEIQVALLRFEKLLAKEDREEAARIIAVTRKKNADRIELWTAEIALAQIRGDGDRVTQLLQDTEKKFGDIPTIRLIKGRYLVQSNAADASVELRKLSEPATTWTEQQRTQLAGGLAPLFISIGDFDDAEKEASILRRAQPTNVPIRLLLMDIALRAKKPELLEQILEEIRAIPGEQAVWHYGQAVRLTLMGQETKNSKDTDEALLHLSKAQAERPTWERIPLVFAEIYDLQGKTRAAIEKYMEAIRLGERAPAVASRVLLLLFNEKRFDEADKFIRQLHETQNLLSDEIARTEVSVSLQLGHKEQAIKTVEQLIRNSKDAQDPLWLGQVYTALQKYGDAEKQYRLAIEANGKDPKPWFGLVLVLAVSKQMEKAEQTIAEAKSAIVADQAMLAVGQFYEILGKPDLARSSYQAALEKSPENFATNRTWVDFLLKTGAAAEAEASLRKILKTTTGTEKDSLQTRNWAQRKLATALLTRGSREQLNEALAIVERNTDIANSKKLEDERLKAIILSRMPLRAQRQQAISILEKLLADEPLSGNIGEDRFLLARLYITQGDQARDDKARGYQAKGRAELRKLVTDQSEDPRYLTAYLQLIIQAGETTEAELYLSKLQKIVPNELATKDLQSQLLFAKGEYTEVINFLKNVGKPSSKEVGKAESLTFIDLWIARRLEEFARLLKKSNKMDEAIPFTSLSEVFYTHFIEKHPEETLALAEFLARTTQIDRALDLLQEHGAKSTVNRVAAVALAAKRNSQATASQLVRLQEVLDANVKSHGQSEMLANISADLMSWRGDSQGAVNMYTQVIHSDSRNVAALNNLAVLIATMGGDHAEAMRLVQQALEFGGPMDALIDTRGLVHLAAGHPEKALVDFQQAIGENESAERRFHEAVAFANSKKQFKAARQSLNLADEIGLKEEDLHPLERVTLSKLRAELKAEDRSK